MNNTEKKGFTFPKMIRFIMSTIYVSVPDGINLETWDLLLFFLDLAVLGVSLTEPSMEDVKKAFQDIAPKLNRESAPMQNLQSVREVRDYLMKNHFRFCVLMIDADRIMRDCGHQPEENTDYRKLLETVANRVGKIWQILLGIVILNRQTREIFLHHQSMLDNG